MKTFTDIKTNRDKLLPSEEGRWIRFSEDGGPACQQAGLIAQALAEKHNY